VLPWREVMHSDFIVSEFLQRLHGRGTAILATVMILWTAFGSVFALLLGYSRIPYAAARDGFFFPLFARVHSVKNFPHVSLLVLGAVSIAAAFFKLDEVISALVTTRILVQFLGQLIAIPLLRRRLPDAARPYKMWLYPLPAVVAFFGWVYIFATSGKLYIALGVITLAAGVLVYGVWSYLTSAWPFASEKTP
jgi:amino acid transporter